MPTTSCSCLRVDRTAGAAASNGALPLRMIACDPIQLNICIRTHGTRVSMVVLDRSVCAARRPHRALLACACVDLYPLQPGLCRPLPTATTPVVQVAAAACGASGRGGAGKSPLPSDAPRLQPKRGDGGVAWEYRRLRGQACTIPSRPLPPIPVCLGFGLGPVVFCSCH